MKTSLHSVEDNVTVPEKTRLLIFYEEKEGSLSMHTGTYNPHTYVRWYTWNGKPILNVRYWATIEDIKKLTSV